MKKILIVIPSSFCEVIYSLQIASLIKEQMDCSIDFVVKDTFLPFVENCFITNNVFAIKQRCMIRASLELKSELKNTSYDFVLNMKGNLKSAFFCFVAKSKMKVCSSNAGFISAFVSNKKLSSSEDVSSMHAIDNLYEFLPFLGLKKNELAPISFKRNEKNESLPEDYILLFTGAKSKKDKWQHYLELANLFLEEGFKLVIAGTSKDIDASKIAILEKDYPNSFVNITGEIKPEELLSIIEPALSVFTNDIDLISFCASMKKEIFAIFSSGNPEKTGPYPLSSKSNFVIKTDDLFAMSAKEVFEFYKDKIF